MIDPQSKENQLSPTDAELHEFGYASGSYGSKCIDCDTEVWHVDKRCHVCRPCAVKRFHKVKELVPSKPMSLDEAVRYAHLAEQQPRSEWTDSEEAAVVLAAALKHSQEERGRLLGEQLIGSPAETAEHPEHDPLDAFLDIGELREALQQFKTKAEEK